MKQGPQLIEDTRNGTLNLDDLVGNTNLDRPALIKELVAPQRQ